MTQYASLDIIPYWSRLNDQLITLLDAIPEDKMDWSPKPELWNLRGILIHINNARHNWLNGVVQDGEPTPDVLRQGQTRDGLHTQFRESWQRLERFLREPSRLDATYQGTHVLPRPEPYSHTGHWIAYHLLEHDIHHRADIFHYLALLGIEHPEVETP